MDYVMKYPEKRRLFTIKEMSQACGISRTTLIRLEESGFLKPYRVDPDSGYRYYDADNIAAIGQYQFLQELGLSRAEITDLYYRNMDVKAFLAEEKEKVYQMSRLINQLEMRLNHDLDFSTSFVDLPEITYYCFNVSDYEMDEINGAAYDTYGKCIKEGLHVRITEPLAAVLEHDWSKPFDMKELTNMQICIPVTDPVDADPHLRTLPAARAFSMLRFGNYSEVLGDYDRLYKEINARGLVTCGPTRGISLVAPYTGSHIKASDYCSQWTVPIVE